MRNKRVRKLRKIIQVSDQKYGHILRKKSTPILKFDDETKELIDELIEICKSSSKDGVTTVGLSAPQIGISKQAFIFYDINKKIYKEVINPKILSQSKHLSTEWEGCASIGSGKKTLFGEVARPRSVTIEYQSVSGETTKLKVRNYLSHVILHEIDHLNGILFTDRVTNPNNILTSTELDKYIKKYKK